MSNPSPVLQGAELRALPADGVANLDNGSGTPATNVAMSPVHCGACGLTREQIAAIYAKAPDRVMNRGKFARVHASPASQRRVGPRNPGNRKHGWYSKYPDEPEIKDAMIEILGMVRQTEGVDMHMVKRAAQLQVMLDPALDILRKVGVYVTDGKDVRARRLFQDVLAGVREERALRSELGLSPRSLATLARDLSAGRAMSATAEIAEARAEAERG